MKEKDITVRIQEVRRLYEQLDLLGLHDGFEAVTEFKRIANEYVKTGASASGVLRIPSVKRKLIYTLTAKTHNACTIVLKAD